MLRYYDISLLLRIQYHFIRDQAFIIAQTTILFHYVSRIHLASPFLPQAWVKLRSPKNFTSPGTLLHFLHLLQALTCFSSSPSFHCHFILPSHSTNAFPYHPKVDKVSLIKVLSPSAFLCNACTHEIQQVFSFVALLVTVLMQTMVMM